MSKKNQGAQAVQPETMMQPVEGDQLTGDLLRLRYVPLSRVVLWDENPKEHDIGGIWASIEAHGFRDPPGYDATAGHLVEGHGRSIVLEMMRRQGKPRPRGIAEHTESGEWCVPVLFGVDAISVEAAQAYAIAHNQLVLAGDEIWNEGLLAQVLGGLQEHGLTGEALLGATGFDEAAMQNVLSRARAEEYSGGYDDFFDATQLPDAQGQAADNNSYMIYVTLPDEESFFRALKTLSLGKRSERRTGTKFASLEGGALLEAWERLLSNGA